MSIDKSAITAAYIQLDVNDKKSLFVLMAKDGTINRLGRGTVDNDQHELFVGKTDDQLFDRFMTEVDESLFQFVGSYQDSDAEGDACKLTMLFQFGEGDDSTGFEFRYGADSQGPPTEICDLIVTCIDLTEPWFEHQISMANKPSA